jgi:deazaflavin-dependent oxidoreductase (nitroreductase family)
MGKIGNRVVAALLRSPLHPTMSGAVLLLTFRGRRSGRWFTTPVQYASTPDGMLVVIPGHPERKQWWRNLRGGAAVKVRLGARDVGATAEVVEDDDRADAARRVYDARFPRAGRALGDRRLAVLVRPDVPA